MDYKPIFAKIKPSLEDEQLIESAKETLMKSILAAAQESEVDIVVQAGGSTAKGTYLNGDFDVDLFVRFKSLSSNFSDQLELLLSDFATTHEVMIERIHGSRDYFTFSFQGLFFEVVPVKFVEEIADVENVTDMSPLHVQWITKHLTPELQDDIRLAKQFCKSALVYGAESFINGVSGHVLDILLVEYGSFDKWVDAVSSWSGVTVIDPNKKHKDVFTSLNQSKLVSPLIVIDPVDSERNAAAAISLEKYNLLIAACKSFKESPSQDFFVIPKFEVKKLMQDIAENESLFVLKVTPQVGKKDVVATRILKVFEFLKRHLQLHEFIVRDANWFYGDESSHLYFFVDKKELDPSVVRQGPPLHLEEDVQKFKDVHKDAFVEGEHMRALIKREFVDPYDCFNHLVASEYVQQRVTSTSVARYK